MNERIKKIRKTLDLTQQDFAERIGLKRNSVALIEAGRNTSEQTITAICREFNVSERWLRNGEGEMFIPPAADTLDQLVREYHLPGEFRVLIEKLINLKPEYRQAVVDYVVDAAEAISAMRTTQSASTEVSAMTDGELHTELQRQIDIEKELAGESGASGRGNFGEVSA